MPLVLVAGCAEPGPEGPPVVLIVLDTFRADHLGAIGETGLTPNLDALAATGALFTECRSAAPITLPSISTILASQWPHVHGVHENYDQRLSDAALTVAEVFRDAGYATGAFVSALPIRAETGCAQGFDVYDDDFTTPFVFHRPEFQAMSDEWTGSERRGRETIDRAVAWMNEVDRTPFLFVHLFDPHSPYDPPPPFDTGYATPYEGEIAHTDALVGELLEVVAMRWGSEPIVAVVADHGEGLGEHGEWAHGFFVYDATMHVPLVLSAPGLPPAVEERPVRTLDLAPTLVDLAGLEIPDVFAGESLLPLLRGEASPPNPVLLHNEYVRLEYGWAPQHGLVDDRWKWIRTARSELYDWRADPSEEDDLVATEADRARMLDAELSDATAREADRARTHGIETLVEDIDPEPRVREWLGNLGYISGLEHPPTGDDLPDAKDEVPVWNATNDARRHLTTAEAALAAGQTVLALQAFEASLAARPLPEARVGRARALVRMGRAVEAETDLTAALAEAPRDAAALTLLGAVLGARGELTSADSVLQRAVLVDPDAAEAHRLRGEFLMRQGKVAAAIDAFERTVALAPTLDALAALAELYSRSARWSEATSAWREVVAGRDWDPQARWRLGQALAGAGATDEARDVLEAARDLAGRGALRDSIQTALDRLP